MGKLVGRSDDEGVERVTRIEPRRGMPAGLNDVLDRRIRYPLLRRGEYRARLGHKHQGRFRAPYFHKRFGQADRVVLRQPVLEKGVGTPDRNGKSAGGDKRRRLEPGEETMTVNIRFD